MPDITEFIYTWDDGREEVRYRRPKDSPESLKMISEITKLNCRAKEKGYKSPYSYRIVNGY